MASGEREGAQPVDPSKGDRQGDGMVFNGMGCGSTSDQMWWQLGTRARMAPMGADAGGEARARRRRSDGCTPRPSSPSDRLLLSVLDLESAAFCAAAPAGRPTRHVICAARRLDLFRRLASQAGEEVFRRVVRTRTHAPAPRSDDQTWIHIPSPACSRAARVCISSRSNKHHADGTPTEDDE